MREFHSQMVSLNKSYTFVLLRANHLNKYTTPNDIHPPPIPHTTHYIREQSYLKGFIYIFYYTYIIYIISLHSSLEYMILISQLWFCGQIFIKLYNGLLL